MNKKKSSERGAPRHPLWLRITHATNALAWIVMTVSGVMIYWANDAYTPFIGRKFYSTLHLDHRLALGLALHFTFMWLFTLTGLLYVSRLIQTGAWRELVPRRGDWLQIPRVALAELGIGTMPDPRGKLNPAQRCVYFGVLVIAAVEIVCGFAIYRPFQLKFLQRLLGGYETARLIHFMIMLALLAFFFMHVAQVIRAGRRDFFAIIIAAKPGQSLASQFRKVTATLTFAFLVLALIFTWADSSHEDKDIVWPLRQALNFNGWIAKKVFRQDAHEKIAASLEASIGGTTPRVNGMIGLEDDPGDADNVIEISQPGVAPRQLTFDQIGDFKQTDSSAQFRCIEGWSRPISYRGVRFRDMMIATGFGTKTGKPYTESTPVEALYPYVGFETANRRYYVSIDIESLLNEQSVLATQMNGEDLTVENGAPLRLIIPVKYGIKNIKRIKRIFFASERPPDYWEERGYDWFAGL